MIKVNSDSTQEKAELHYANCSFYIGQILRLYIDFFRIINKEIKYQKATKILYLDSKLSSNSITYLLKSLAKNPNKSKLIKKRNVIKICQNPSSYIDGFYSKNRLNLLNFFSDIDSNLKKILSSEPQILVDYQVELIKNFSNFFDDNDAIINQIRKLLLKHIFNYDRFSTNINDEGFPTNNENEEYWNKYKFSKLVDIKTCPYCNQNNTFTVIGSDLKGVISPSIDHFFCKSKFPLFALSYFNLIPACTNCNTLLKGDKIFSLNNFIHPYLDGFDDDSIFTYKPYTFRACVGDSDELSIWLKTRNNARKREKIENNIEVFKLNDTYSEHSDRVQELIRKKIVSNNRYLEILRAETYKDFNLSEQEAYLMAFGNFIDEKDFHKRPLAKMTKDIVKELNLIK